ncbi:MAG: Smr/MutS family protein [Gemmatimonadetes bacterium]|nr:Smr/MutS family protein [Gemmatimonadota bacterium]
MARRKRRSTRDSTPLPSFRDEVHPSLDLHGETAESGRRRAEAWLREMQGRAVRTVRVITGRGTRSPGPPVLRGEIGEMLEALRGTVVSYFTLDSGGGAFRVELERVRPRKRRTADSAALRGTDPELRRRAEEALWELGVDPTPALVAAEIRRILGEAERGS